MLFFKLSLLLPQIVKFFKKELVCPRKKNNVLIKTEIFLFSFKIAVVVGIVETLAFKLNLTKIA